MGRSVTSRYDQDFIGRVRAAREQRFATQSEAATALGMRQDKYKQYEVRSLLPHSLIPQFCKVCGVSVQWLVASEGAGPKWQPFVPSPRGRSPAKTHRRVA